MPLIPVLAKRRRHKISPTNWDPNALGLSIWAAYEPKGAASLAASYVDLSGNGNDAAPGVAPTLSSGWVFNGGTQYLTTTFAPANDQNQAVFVQYADVIQGNRYLLGKS